MSEPIEVTSQAIEVRRDMPVSQALRVDEILAQVKLIQEVMHKVMVDKEHYGTIPGCGDKKTLLQPGAQKLTMTFRLAPEYEIQEVNLERGHKEYRVVCTLKSIQSGTFVGQGVGCCSTMESKYRWRGGVRKCPQCGKEAIIMGKQFKPTDPPPGWLCWKKKGGCGATWPAGSTEIESQSIEKVENDNPADCYNTVLKIAKKRAFVDATITATAASDIFTQDVGDEEQETFEAAPEAPTTRQHTQQATTPQPQPKSAPESKPSAAKSDSDPVVGPKWRMTLLHRLLAAPGEANRGVVQHFLMSKGWITGEQQPEDWPIFCLPKTKEEFDKLTEEVQAFDVQMREQPIAEGVAE